MSLGLIKTKRRILTVKSTQKITKAMEMVATVKLKKFHDLMDRDSFYHGELLKLMGVLFDHDLETGTHYGKLNPNAHGTLYVVFSSNLGLCAGYNNNLFRFVDSLLKPIDTVAPIGNKGISHFRHDEKYQRLSMAYADLNLNVDMKEIHRVCAMMKDQFNEGRYQRIVIVYTKYVNSMSFMPMTRQLLPVTIPSHVVSDMEQYPPLFEPDARKMIHELLPQYLASVFYSKLVEAQLSEQASRRTAMDAANNNADDLLDKLTIQYNKARQGLITQQITEVVSAANVQK